MNKFLPLLIVLFGAVGGSMTGLFVFVQGAAPLLRQAKAATEEDAAVVLLRKPWDFWTLEIAQLSDELEGRLTSLDAREADVVAREDRLAAAMLELEQARSEVQNLREELSRQVGQIQEDEAKNLRNLAKTYGEMKPAAALPIMRELSDDTVVKILSLWKPDQVRPLLDEISKNAGHDPDMVRRAGFWSERLRLVPQGTG